MIDNILLFFCSLQYKVCLITRSKKMVNFFGDVNPVFAWKK